MFQKEGRKNYCDNYTTNENFVLYIYDAPIFARDFDVW